MTPAPADWTPQDSIQLQVRNVIGSEGPTASFELLPLIVDWKVPRQCVWTLTGNECTKPLVVIYALVEPVKGHPYVGACAEHHERLLVPQPGAREAHRLEDADGPQ